MNVNATIDDDFIGGMTVGGLGKGGKLTPGLDPEQAMLDYLYVRRCCYAEKVPVPPTVWCQKGFRWILDKYPF